MSSIKKSYLDEESAIQISFPRRDCFLYFKIIPESYFYYLPFHLVDSLKINNEMRLWTDHVNRKKLMLCDKKFKELFRDNFLYKFRDFLKSVQKEAEIEYENEISLKQSVKPRKDFEIIKTPLLDLYFEKNKDAIFEYIEKYGLVILMNKTVCRNIFHWVKNKKIENIEKLLHALRILAKIFPGPTPLSGEKVTEILKKYPKLLEQLEEMKKAITLFNQDDPGEEDLSNQILIELKKRKYWWYENIKSILEKENVPRLRRGQELYKISSIFEKNSPRRLSLKILGNKYKKGWATIDKIVRLMNKPPNLAITLY